MTVKVTYSSNTVGTAEGRPPVAARQGPGGTVSDIITIGRNVKDEPMAAELWDDFRSDIRQCFDRVEAVITGRSWSQEWGAEETYVVIGRLGVRNDAVVNVGWTYSQEAIGIGVIDAQSCERLLARGEG